MKVSFYTLGCKLNYAESSELSAQFKTAGFTVVEFGEKSDIVIVNTCTVTENADTECRKIIRRALRISPSAYIGVTGCYAQLQPEEIASIDGVDAVFGSKEKFSMAKLVPTFEKSDAAKIYVSDLSNLDFHSAHSSDGDSRTRAHLKLQDGCNYSCSFCTIPLARGASRSIEFQNIGGEIESLLLAGYSEIVLSGINLGDYSAEDGRNFFDVIKFIESQHYPARFRISSIEPNLLKPEMVEFLLSSDSFVPHFHIPLQSGSPEILAKMRRRYNVGLYQNLICQITSIKPDCCIGVDVIVGFPGEGDVHFEETFRFLMDLPLSYLHVFSYSERANTPAASYPGKVPKHIRRERTHRLRLLSEMKKRDFYLNQAGSHRLVIPEQYEEAGGTWVGWTENYVRTRFYGSPYLPQNAVKVRLLHLDNNDIMYGEVLDSRQHNLQTTSQPYFPLQILSNS